MIGAAAILLILAAVGWIAWRGVPSAGGDGDLADAVGGPFTLVDQDGRTVTEASWPGKYRLIFFGYTYCPDVCPTTLGQVAGALDRLGPAAAQVQPLFVTVDPARDTPQVLKGYTAAFDGRILGLSGSAAQVAAAEKAFRVLARRVDQDGPVYLMQHTALLYFMGPDGRLRDLYAPDTTADALAAKMKAAMGG